MSIHERTLNVIQAFYDAALDDTPWRAALESLCELSGSQAASFWVLDGSDQPRLPTFIYINFDISSIKEYIWRTRFPSIRRSNISWPIRTSPSFTMDW
jgi:hypothetical protein